MQCVIRDGTDDAGREITLRDRLLRLHVSRGKRDLYLDLADLLVDDERPMARVEAVFLELPAELEETLAIDIDASRGTARVVLPDEEEHRHFHAVDVRDRVAPPVDIGHVRRRAAEEIGVVLLERLHLVLERRDVVADRDDPNAERPALRLHAETEEGEVAAPRSAGEDGALGIGDAELDDPVVHLRDVLELRESRPPDDRVAP